MKKIIAKQVPPKYQESPLFNDHWPEDVFVYGNPHYNEHADRLKGIWNALEELANVWDLLNNGENGYFSWRGGYCSWSRAAEYTEVNG